MNQFDTIGQGCGAFRANLAYQIESIGLTRSVRFRASRRQWKTFAVQRCPYASRVVNDSDAEGKLFFSILQGASETACVV